MTALIYLVTLAATTADTSIPDEIERPALEHEIMRRGALVACIDVRDRSAPKQFLSGIKAPGHTVVALSDCVWSQDGVKSATGEAAVNLSVDRWARKSSIEVHVTISWHRSSAESGEETLVLRQESGVWRVSQSLGERVV